MRFDAGCVGRNNWADKISVCVLYVRIVIYGWEEWTANTCTCFSLVKQEEQTQLRCFVWQQNEPWLLIDLRKDWLTFSFETPWRCVTGSQQSKELKRKQNIRDTMITSYKKIRLYPHWQTGNFCGRKPSQQQTSYWLPSHVKGMLFMWKECPRQECCTRLVVQVPVDYKFFRRRSPSEMSVITTNVTTLRIDEKRKMCKQ